MRLLLVFLLLLPGLLSAATFTVTSTADTSDPGTLRWAIEQHNVSGTSNEIFFDPALAGQTITIVDPAIAGHLPNIGSGGTSLTIDGSAAPGLTIDRNGGARIFIVNTNGVFTLRNLRLTNASGPFGGTCLIALNSSVDIVLEDMVFDSCVGDSSSSRTTGGAVRTEFTSGGSLTIRDSLFIANRAESGADVVLGGAVYSEDGNVRIERSVFELNSVVDSGSAFTQGGAVYISNGEADLFDNEFLFNQAAEGAGGALVMNLLPTSSSFTQRNLFAGNVAELGAAVWTGTQFIGTDFPFFNFSNNTFLANTSSSSSGGAIFTREARLLLSNNSFIQNANTSSGAAHLAYNESGTVFFSIWNNLMGPSTTDACRSNSGTPGTFTSAGYNLLPDASCEISGFNDIIADAGPFLPLANYGGVVRTVPPAAGNLAIDNGNPNPIVPGNASLCRASDARGIDRPGDGDADGDPICDIGAFEWSGEAPLFFDSFEQAGLIIP